MLGYFVSKITLSRIRLQFGKDIPDSGQEHPTHSNDRLFVTTASFDSAIPFLAFGIFVGFDDGVRNLH